jgi:hypothetical protein
LICNCFKIDECESTIKFWSTQELSNNDLKLILMIISKIKSELNVFSTFFVKILMDYQDFDVSFSKSNFAVQEKNQEILKLKNYYEGVPIAIKGNSFTYQREERVSIEKEFFKTRVMDAHYRNQPINVLKKYENGMIKQLVIYFYVTFFL